MDEEDLTPLAMLLVIAVGAILVETRPKIRERMLTRIGASVGDPRIVPIHDGDHLRMTVELKRLYERLLPSWTSP